uniref:Reverse transcriptase domain-containing protein n=1 Tax=Macrostomum lignano TaxID=282301 RepID=A0A1I8H8K9_9PLAT
MEQYFICNKVESTEAKRATFLTAIGEKHYKLLRDLCHPDKLTTKTFEQLRDVLKNHCSPAPSEIAARFKFQRRMQQEGESFTVFLAGLKSAAVHCNFGSTLNERLRDQLVFGMSSDAMRSKLLESANNSYEALTTLAISLETSQRSSSEMSLPSSTHRVEKTLTQFELDTGSAVSLAPKSFYDQHLSHLPLRPSRTTLRTYTDQEFCPLGEVTVSINYEGQSYALPLLIVSEGGARLLGRNWLTAIRLDWPRLTAPVNAVAENPNDIAAEIIQQFPDVFADNLGNTGASPSELLFGRRLRSRLDLLRPSLAEQMRHRQSASTTRLDAPPSPVLRNEHVREWLCKDAGWRPGLVMAAGKRNYDVKVGEGIVQRHIDQLLPEQRQQPPAVPAVAAPDRVPPSISETTPPSEVGPDSSTSETSAAAPTAALAGPAPAPITEVAGQQAGAMRRYPERIRLAPARFQAGTAAAAASVAVPSSSWGAESGFVSELSPTGGGRGAAGLNRTLTEGVHATTDSYDVLPFSEDEYEKISNQSSEPIFSLDDLEQRQQAGGRKLPRSADQPSAHRRRRVRDRTAGEQQSRCYYRIMTPADSDDCGQPPDAASDAAAVAVASSSMTTTGTSATPAGQSGGDRQAVEDDSSSSGSKCGISGQKRRFTRSFSPLAVVTRELYVDASALLLGGGSQQQQQQPIPRAASLGAIGGSSSGALSIVMAMETAESETGLAVELLDAGFTRCVI